MTLAVGTIRPQLDAAAVSAAAARARTLLRGDITLLTGKALVRVSPKTAKRNGSALAGAVTKLPGVLVSALETTW